MMNCKEIEKDIYLYDELTASKKAIIDAHVIQCKSCKEIFDELHVYQFVIQKVATEKPQPENYSKLTSNIMQAIDVQESHNGFFKFFEGLFVRYAFAAASLTLIIFFLVEQQIETGTEHQQITNAQSTTVILKTSGTLQTIRNKKESSGSITSFYACVKSGDCSNSLSKTLN